jgi:hypothetical protein
MSTFELFKIIQTSSMGRAIGGLDHLFCAAIELAHILGMLLVLSSVILVSLRLLGLGLRNQSLNRLYCATSGFIWTGLGLLVISGLLIFIPAATSYYPNEFFWIKFILLGLALLIHLTIFRNISLADMPNSIVSKLTAVLCLSLWFGVAFAGRFIGFF